MREYNIGRKMFYQINQSKSAPENGVKKANLFTLYLMQKFDAVHFWFNNLELHNVGSRLVDRYAHFYY